MRVFAILAPLAIGALAPGGATAQQPKTKAAAPRDWSTHVVQAPSGAYLIGNPTAKVRLVEYLSYTCGHCAEFMAEAKLPLKNGYVRRGTVRIEVRHAVRDPIDMAAALLARCAGPGGFVSATDAIFAEQRDWARRGAAWWSANAAALQSETRLMQLKAAAEGSGLSGLMRGRGMSDATIDRCFATPTDLNRLTAMADASWKVIRGTPTFVINGKTGGGGHWETLEPELRAAGAR
ncbi:DsbA family protein [Sphingomonas sp.]|uniref:DsbA family protein n=1 Tax=Sphingomonas sp. TaxID=28214 RepID=UPI003BAB241F